MWHSAPSYQRGAAWHATQQQLAWQQFSWEQAAWQQAVLCACYHPVLPCKPRKRRRRSSSSSSSSSSSTSSSSRSSREPKSGEKEVPREKESAEDNKSPWALRRGLRLRRAEEIAREADSETAKRRRGSSSKKKEEQR